MDRKQIIDHLINQVGLGTSLILLDDPRPHSVYLPKAFLSPTLELPLPENLFLYTPHLIAPNGFKSLYFQKRNLI
jgi:hypothetical protein